MQLYVSYQLSELYPSSLKFSDLSDNPLNCDCNIRWLPEFLRSANESEDSPATCATPVTLAGNAVFNLTEDVFLCGKFV